MQREFSMSFQGSIQNGVAVFDSQHIPADADQSDASNSRILSHDETSRSRSYYQNDERPENHHDSSDLKI